MMLTLMIFLSIIITVTINVLSSCWVCYNIVIDKEQQLKNVISVTGVILLNAMVPFTLGCVTGLYSVM